jgi:protein TonB
MKTGTHALTKSAIAALAIEAAIISGLLVVAAKKPVHAEQHQQVVMLDFPEPVKKEAPPPKETPKEIPRPVQHRTAQPQHREEPVQQFVEPKPVAEAAPVTLPSKPPEPPRPAPQQPAVSETFKDAVRAAVQAAVVYPPSARMAHIFGRTKMGFRYQNGQVSNPSVIVSSGYAMLDAAARRAVESASYPVPPAEFSGKPLQFEVWVNFTLSQQDDD